MSDKLLALKIPPGIRRNGTKYQSSGHWYDAQLVRFIEDTIKPVGGWRRLRNDDGTALAPLAGKPRAAISWRTDTGDTFIAIATHTKLYGYAAGVPHDITPTGFTSGPADTAPATSGGTYGNGAYGTGPYGAGATAESLVLAATWQLDTFGKDLAAVCTSNKKLYVWDADFGTLPKEPRVVGVGTVSTVAGAATFSTTQADVVYNGSRVVVGSTEYVVSAFNGTTGATFSGSPTFGASAFSVINAPRIVSGVVVTPERFLVTLGWYNGAQNVRGVAWPSQETTTQWDPTLPGSTAGDFEITTDGELVCGKRTKGETLLWTTTDLHAMQYIGGTLLYRFVLLGEKCGIVSPRAAVTFDSKAMWMGHNNFFAYDGFVQPIPCSIHDYIFGDFNQMQAVKVWSTTIAEFGEVWWFYPSAISNECDRYVVYNYRENHWNMGRMRRAAGFDAGALPSPLFVAPSGEAFEHEIAGGARPSVAGEEGGVYLLIEGGGVILLESGGGILIEAMHPHLESGPIEIGDGDRLMNVQRLIPDEKTLGEVVATFYGSLYPTALETTYGPYPLEHQTNVRFKARQTRIRLDENGISDWRVGQIRLGVREAERR